MFLKSLLVLSFFALKSFAGLTFETQQSQAQLDSFYASPYFFDIFFEQELTENSVLTKVNKTIKVVEFGNEPFEQSNPAIKNKYPQIIISSNLESAFKILKQQAYINNKLVLVTCAFDKSQIGNTIYWSIRNMETFKKVFSISHREIPFPRLTNIQTSNITTKRNRNCGSSVIGYKISGIGTFLHEAISQDWIERLAYIEKLPNKSGDTINYFSVATDYIYNKYCKDAPSQKVFMLNQRPQPQQAQIDTQYYADPYCVYPSATEKLAIQ